MVAVAALGVLDHRVMAKTSFSSSFIAGATLLFS